MGSRTRWRRSGALVLAVVVLSGCELATARASRTHTGAQADGASAAPAISDDGNLVAFTSAATNLVPGDTNAAVDVFARDVAAGTTTRVSVSGAGAQANAASGGPALSGDGRFVAFTSAATTLVGGSVAGRVDVYVHDRQTRATTREGPAGSVPSLSDDGRILAYARDGQVLIRDRQVGTTTTVPTGIGTYANDPDVSGDGRFVALGLRRASGGHDIWLYDRSDALLDRLSYFDDWAYQPNVSDDGRVVAFGEAGGDSVWAVDAHTGVVTDLPGSLSYTPDISDDGTLVVFRSEDRRLVVDDTNRADDVFVHDLATGTTTRASVDPDGVQANGPSDSPVMSGDGRHVAFASSATNLVSGDTNGVADVFRRDGGERTAAVSG